MNWITTSYFLCKLTNKIYLDELCVEFQRYFTEFRSFIKKNQQTKVMPLITLNVPYGRTDVSDPRILRDAVSSWNESNAWTEVHLFLQDLRAQGTGFNLSGNVQSEAPNTDLHITVYKGVTGSTVWCTSLWPVSEHECCCYKAQGEPSRLSAWSRFISTYRQHKHTALYIKHWNHRRMA
jgi:hypothetical protein